MLRSGFVLGTKTPIAALTGLVDKTASSAAHRDSFWECRPCLVENGFEDSILGCSPKQLKRSVNQNKCEIFVSLTTLSRPFPQNANSFPDTDNHFSDNGNVTSQPISFLRCNRHVQADIGILGPLYRNDIRILTPRSQISAIARRLLQARFAPYLAIR